MSSPMMQQRDGISLEEKRRRKHNRAEEDIKTLFMLWRERMMNIIGDVWDCVSEMRARQHTIDLIMNIRETTGIQLTYLIVFYENNCKLDVSCTPKSDMDRVMLAHILDMHSDDLKHRNLLEVFCNRWA